MSPAAPLADDAPVVIVSNRGPLSFQLLENGDLVPRRGAGGLVSGLGTLARRESTTWICSAISDADRQAAAVAGGTIAGEGFRVHMLQIDRDDYTAAYDRVSNGTLWFVHHRLFDLSREPSFDRSWWEAWEAYKRVNDQFASAVCESAPPSATVLVQDYHLSLVGSRLKAERPDLRAVHFHHTPFAEPSDLAVLPSEVARTLLDGLGGFAACGFHTQRWADAYQACRTALGVTEQRSFVSPLGVDPDELAVSARSDDVDAALSVMQERVRGCHVITRVDRIELSKNILRGFDAFDELLDRWPEWRGTVVFVACCYPSREGLDAYATYLADVEARVAQLNERWSTTTWTPIIWDGTDDYPTSLAALRRADVVLVNPIRDGLNLVAKEAAVIGERDPSIVLSTEAGCYEEIGRWCDAVNPFDVSATATALDAALRRSPHQRAAAAADRRNAVLARTPDDWLDDQLGVAG